MYAVQKHFFCKRRIGRKLLHFLLVCRVCFSKEGCKKMNVLICFFAVCRVCFSNNFLQAGCSNILLWYKPIPASNPSLATIRPVVMRVGRLFWIAASECLGSHRTAPLNRCNVVRQEIVQLHTRTCTFSNSHSQYDGPTTCKLVYEKTNSSSRVGVDLDDVAPLLCGRAPLPRK